MKKRLTALFLAAAFSLSAMPIAMADDWTEENKYERDIAVATDLKVKQDSDAAYSTNYLTIVSETGAVVDLQAKIEMGAVSTAVNRYEDYAKDTFGETITATLLPSCKVTGGFTINIKYDENSNVVIPDSVKNDKNMIGFSSEGNKHLEYLCEPDARVVQDGQITVNVKVKDNVTMDVLKANLGDLTFTLEGVQLNAKGKYTCGIEVTGNTDIEFVTPGSAIRKINYKFNDVDATVVIKAPSTGGSGGSLGGTDKPVVNKRKLTIVIGGGIEPKVYEYNQGAEIDMSEIPQVNRPGYKLEGYYDDPEFTKPVGESIIMNEDVTIYAKWEGDEEGPKPVLETDNHIAYIIGYPKENGVVNILPNNRITREEVAIIFYRLLKDEVRESLKTTENNFTDVQEDRWSNLAISTIANGGYIVGYEGDVFKPADKIKRGEFITIAARFFGINADSAVEDSGFEDAEEHWAKVYIDYAKSVNWIDGYEDGLSRPDQDITRAEAMKIINSMLNRHVNAEGIHPDAIQWVDNPETAWYYYEVLEATNAHNYERAEDEVFEKWTEVLDPNIEY